MTGTSGPGIRVALVGGDLLAEARIREAVERAGGHLVRAAPDAEPIDLVVVDLEGAPAARPPARKVLGYYPHVRSDLAEAARRSGIEALPRGRFFRELPSLIEGLTEPTPG